MIINIRHIVYWMITSDRKIWDKNILRGNIRRTNCTYEVGDKVLFEKLFIFYPKLSSSQNETYKVTQVNDNSNVGTKMGTAEKLINVGHVKTYHIWG